MKTGLSIDIHALFDQRRVEGLRIEYKAEWNHVCGSSALKTICAFANDLLNVNGGWVVFGVEEQDGRPVLPPRGIAEDALERVQQEVLNAVHRISPRYVPLILAEEMSGRWLVVVECPAGDARPYEAPCSLKKNETYARFVRLGSITREAKDALSRRLDAVSERVPFDDRACFDASLDDISPALLHHHLREAGSRWAEEHRADAEIDVPALCRRLLLSKRTNGHEVPRNVALLFFNQAPRRWFRGARIEVASLPEGRAGNTIIERSFEGPLPSLLKSALDHLKGLIPEQIRKVSDRAESIRTEAWPFDAVEEALVNAVHHRGYGPEHPDPIKIEILPTLLRITSYPGPVEGVSREHFQRDDAPPVPSRNRRIADLLKDVDLAEARGTGWPRIRRAMAQNGSPFPQVNWDEARTWFEVVLPIHPAFLHRPEDGARAQPLRPGRPAPADDVVGREALVEQAWRTLLHRSLLLTGPPGRGASSLLNAVVAAAPADRPVCMVKLAGASADGLLAALLAWDEKRPEPALTRSEIQDLAAVLSRLGEQGVVLALDHLDEVGQRDPEPWREQERVETALLDAIERSPTLRLVATVHGLAGLDDEAQQRWASLARQVPVPPLSAAATRELATRLLRGCQLPVDAATVEALALHSAGLPGLLVRLVEHLHIEGPPTAEGVEAALMALAAEPGDPTGLRERARAMEAGFPAAQGALLDAVAASADGLPRNDLLAVSAGRAETVFGILDALKALELGGWLVEVDGRLRFEHPWLRDALNRR